MRHSVTEARLCTLVRCCSGRLSLESLDTDCACAVLRAASCAELCLADLRLGGRATRALVAAMSAGVGTVHLGRGGEVSLHMESLARYSGRGACCSLQLWYGTWTRSAQYSTALVRHLVLTMFGCRYCSQYSTQQLCYLIFA